ncbi:GHKL domain-containing protein [Fulvivirga kasyanovii]|uniref:GHKL domain-containing protein n=2 Tax=Fulvivirga kasyanovii TaxID=396812 RepID=A0ABW9RV60_9BACT|nr:GHKL domain-containing protein [Fulvivirga kasyanovii]
MILNVTKGKRLIKRYRYWLMAMAMIVILIFLESDLEEPFFSFLAFIFFGLIAFWVARWLFNQIKSTLKLKKDKANTELLHLQSQVNPHFFFNTLNNLYGLMDKDVGRAKSMVLKLSDMMRYSIYDGQKGLVLLEQEVEYLNNYIELHKARYHKKIDIRFTCHIQTEGVEVVPLMFIILLENAFKHGVENLREEAYIQMSLIANENEVSFAVENNFDLEEASSAHGIGIKNLKRRLQLAYPKRHSLKLKTLNDIYKAQLTLKLT